MFFEKCIEFKKMPGVRKTDTLYAKWISENSFKSRD